MDVFAPDYYQDFACIKEACRHNCCIGWEIGIDENACARYRKVTGAFGERLRQSIALEDDEAHFVLGKDERCPFLNENNLCEIILNLGEGALCQVCDDHPRYRNFFDSRTEMGLGLCCEAAAALILRRKEKVQFIKLTDEGTSAPPTAEEQVFFQLREKLYAIVQDRSKPIDARIQALLDTCSLALPKQSFAAWADVFLQLERLDDTWTEKLLKLKAVTEIPPERFSAEEWEIAFEQLLLYFLHRHLAEGLYDGRIPERILFSVLGLVILRALCVAENAAALHTLETLARMYSAEIEYAEENTEALLALLF